MTAGDGSVPADARFVEAVELPGAYRLLNHGPVTLVSSAHGGRRNLMAASWAMPLDYDPPKVLVVIDGRTLTRELVEASGEFALNIPPVPMAQAVFAAGSRSGRDGDKFAALGLGAFAARCIGAPLVAGCVGWLECRVVREPRNEQCHDLFIGEVVAAAADRRAFSQGRWHFEDEALRTLHYTSGGVFHATGARIAVRG